MKYIIDLNDEIIDGYSVTADVKKIWNAQLELLDKFQQVCEKYNLPYFASGGTLLGAIRHNGYIPWDDDIDIHMLASDYEKFCKVAPEELKPYFWQEWRTEEGYYPWHAKIRNSNTTGCTKWEFENWSENMNKGIFIDIFPLHYIPKYKIIHKIQKFLLSKVRNGIYLYLDEKANKNNTTKKRILFKLVSFFASYKTLCKLFINICNWQKKPSDFVGATTFDFKVERFIWSAKNYRETVDLPFMGGTIKAPVDWDACLRRQFGDYKKPAKSGQMHSDIIFDVDVPYAEKLKGLKQY